jgi:hypothetical protein
VNNSEVTAEHLYHITPGKIGMVGRKYKGRTYTENILPVKI